MVGWSSVEVLWEQTGPASAATAVAATAEDPSDPEGDCPCFCACACQAVHVVLSGQEEPGRDRVTPTFELISDAAAPQESPADPPYHPPRIPA